ncbi:MAG TPA: hypothetical protein VFY87_16255, partial [Geminicoccaceae bacterium]|nr:hypothetical protein [Geminicoccaceae bacterium]
MVAAEDRAHRPQAVAAPERRLGGQVGVDDGGAGIDQEHGLVDPVERRQRAPGDARGAVQPPPHLDGARKMRPERPE